jgi:hypothetical protein
MPPSVWGEGSFSIAAEYDEYGKLCNLTPLPARFKQIMPGSGRDLLTVDPF